MTHDPLVNSMLDASKKIQDAYMFALDVGELEIAAYLRKAQFELSCALDRVVQRIEVAS